VSAEISNWIPRKRIHVAIALAAALAVTAITLGARSPFALLLLAPAAGAAWAAFVMLRIRQQLSPAGGGWQAQIHDLVAARLSIPATSHAALLDIGCGDGSLLIRLLDQAPTIDATGIDFWGANWDYAQSSCERRIADRGHHASLHRMNAVRLEFPDSHFDIVVSVMCFHEVQTPAQATREGPLLALCEALRVLRPGGMFVFIDRFADRADYGPAAELDQILTTATDLHRESLVDLLDLPWPLGSTRALGPAQLISGRTTTSDRSSDR
jgi:SAM-dependent methyltransferase